MIQKCLLSFLLVFAISQFAVAQRYKADDIVGTWVTRENKAQIQIFRSGNKYNGKIAWLKNPLLNGQPKVDSKNPKADLRQQPIIGLEILKGFAFDNDDVWEDGTIYDPESGKTYSCKITMTDRNTIRVRGYIGVSLLGRTEVWKRG